MSIFGKMDPKLERKVFIFTTLLVIAMFVTMALYVYAGEQQRLPTREFGSVNVRKSLGVNGITFNSSSVSTLIDEEIMVISDTTNIYNADTGTSNITVYLPTVTQLSSLKQFKIGRGFSVYLINDNANTVTVDVDPNDSSRLSILNTPVARGNGVTEIIIRRTSDQNYQAILV
jgi:hypothetical protein